LTDPLGLVPEFLRDFNALSARALNSHYGRRENLWSSDAPSVVELVDAGDVTEKIVYTLCNPVSSFLVSSARHWPGVRSTPAELGTAKEIAMPSGFFRVGGDMPATAALRLEAPEGEDLEEFRTRLETLVEAREEECRQEVAQSGRRFLGVRAVLARSHEARATSEEPRREIRPAIACKNRTRRDLEIQRLKTFVSEYREALREFIRGVRDVLFPHGTYRMLQKYRVRCLSPPEEAAVV
jgi:hypothetical protein